jgi:transcriptional regulator with XRE-family HTH domain
LEASLCNVKYYRDEKFLKQFGERLKQIRKSKNISQEQLAWSTGFELSQIGRIERGLINTSISHVAKIAEALAISPAELFEGLN